MKSAQGRAIMWPRNVEAMLALWLALSPFIFHIPGRHTGAWAVDLGAAVLIMVFSLASYWKPLRRAYVGTLAVGLGLAIYGLVQSRPPPSWHQNHILVGLLLVMFAIIPVPANAPPRSWRRSPSSSRT
jgi:peptidoglycan/LPS O-acetylase OafA/YrhL